MVELLIEGIKADLSEDISGDITFSLADIRTPEKRQVDYTKTITLEGTSLNNYIFGNIFDIDVENDNFNPTLPNIGVNYTPKKLAKAQLIADGVQIFDGTLRLWKITLKDGIIFYEISLFGRLFDLFSSLGDKKLTDIDFSDLNHALTWENVKLTWANNFKGAFRYPFVDYGMNQLSSIGRPDEFKFGSLVPAIHYKVYLDRIFSTNNANYTLNFADKTIFEKMIVTPSVGQIIATPKYFEGIFDKTDYSRMYYAPSYNLDKLDYDYFDIILDVWDTTPTNNILRYLTGAPNSVYMAFKENISTSFQYNIEIEVDFYLYDFNKAIPILFLIKTIVGVQPAEVPLQFSLYLDPSIKDYSFTLELPRADYVKDQVIVPMVQMCPGANMRVKKGSSVKAVSPIDTSVYPLIAGEIFDMNKMIPAEIKQIEFIKDFIRLFNLFVTQDINNPSTYVFTPQNNFYITDKTKAINWTNKIDYASEIEFTPISQLTAKEYIFTWKNDKDFWTDYYFQQYKEVYGQISYLTDTDVLKNVEKIEMLFSPAVMTRYKGSKVISPAIYKVEVNNGVQTKKVDKFNSRLLIWGGLFPAGHDINLKNADGTTAETITSYPYAGHLDKPVNPTFDLNFGNTNSDLPTANRNQFSVYWGKSLREANHKDGKLISCSMLLKTEDVESLDFAGLYKVGDQFYRLNLISGYNPFNLSICKVELIKVISL